MDDEEPLNFRHLLFDAHQNGLHAQQKEEDGRQDRDSPVRVKCGTSEIGNDRTWDAIGYIGNTCLRWFSMQLL